MSQASLIDDEVERVSALAVLRALRSLRIIRAGQDEEILKQTIAQMMVQRGLPARCEYSFGPRCRADIWSDGIVIEVKKKRPVLADLLTQVTRYALQPSCREIIVVLERSVVLPGEIEGKRISTLSLNSLWGVAL